MKQYKNHTIKEYLDVLSKKTPVPGGGSAAALTGATGAGLLSMVANYSKGKGKTAAVEKRIVKTLNETEKIRKRLLELVDLDAKAYLNVVKTKNATKAVKNKALRQAKAVPREVCRLCYKAVKLSPVLVDHGNKYLIADVAVAIELLFASFNSALTLEISQ